jgi:hypothetical protein
MDGETTAAILHPMHRTSRALTGAVVDTYEAGMRVVVDLERFLARTVPSGPLGWVAGDLADLTRDATAIQLSTIRWMLDL